MADAGGMLEARTVNQLDAKAPAAKTKPIKGADNLDWGMRNRLSRLIGPDGRCQFLPIDHGYFQGPIRNLEQPGVTISELLPYADGLFVTRGVLRSAITPDISTPIILRVSGGSSVVGEDLANEILTVTIEEMLRLNVAAVGISVFVGSEYETQTLQSLADLVSTCEDFGIPVMAVTAVGRELSSRSPRRMALACRICAELGAKVVKTYYTKGFDKVASGCPVPVIMAGGPKCETELEVFEFVYDGLDKGAIGVNLGRNIWQSEHPLPMMRALSGIIHDNLTAPQAQEFYQDLINA